MAAAQAGVVLRHIRNLAQRDDHANVSDPDLLARFTSANDETAFAALVRRHGGMVLGVCRRVLGNHADADDAFQATFLALAKKAHAIARQQSLPGWLYQVAYRVALKARSRAAARQKHERNAGGRGFADPLAEITGRELVGVLDEELQGLAERHRAPLVLCYLEGNTCDEAARRLGCSPSTLKRRLDQGRRCLGRRLTRRGLSLPAVLLAAGAAHGACGVTVPARLAAQAAETALHTSRASGTAVALAEAVLKAGPGVRLWTGSLFAVLTAAALLAASALPTPEPGRARAAQPAAAAPQAPTPKPAAPVRPSDTERRLTVSGSVLNADGKPLAGAAVAVIGRARHSERGGDLLTEGTRVFAQGRTGEDGRFRLSAAGISADRLHNLFLVARGPGHGVSLTPLNPDRPTAEVAVRLKPERVIRGRLVDLQGQPAAGATVSVRWIGQSPNGMPSGVNFYNGPPGLAVWPAAVKTDAQGRFTLHGLSGEFTAGLSVAGERYAPQAIYLDPREFATEVNRSLAPAQTIEGQVLQADTGKPIPHALLTVYSSERELGSYGGLGGKADAQGRFRINPHPGKWFTISAHAPSGEPYLAVEKRFKWDSGKVKVQMDLKLPRGVLIRGKVTEAGSGKPVAKAAVQYYPQRAINSNFREGIVYGWQGTEVSGEDGSYAMTVLPGPGHLLFIGPDGRYVHEEIGGNVLFNGRPGGLRFYADAVRKLDYPKEAREKHVDVTLRRGVTIRGRLLAPDGQPLLGKALMLCKLHVSALSPFWRAPEEIRDGQFELHGVDPEKGCRVAFLDPQRKWGATVELSGKPAGGPVTVKLQPCGTAKARYVDPDGKPLAGMRPMINVVVTPGAYRYDPKEADSGKLHADEEFQANVDRHNYWNAPRTDAEGRITFPALIPGMTYRAMTGRRNQPAVGREFTARSGETVDLRDIVHDRPQ